uniref:Iron-containing alcohol dehydrogenase n=1 Tax=uncultured bacterium Contig87 TaxID=1393621 RepID=W0FJT7_9BACT|nr:iron-containing alcohol dehydrogenase [uncultured bacterium Contig87]
MPFYLGRKAIRKVPGAVIKAAPIPRPDLIQGFGTREEAGKICEDAGFGSVLLVTDQTLYGLGLHEKVVSSLEQHSVKCSVFHDIHSEPTADIVKAGRAAAVACEADCVIALGGGSVLDSSKIIAASARHPQLPLRHYLHKFAIVEGGSLPMINIPSTAGTGAECTVGAVIKKRSGTKNSTVLIGLNVASVILDSELLINAPKSVTAWCAIDALSHGMEGLLADVGSTDEDIRKSRECVRLILENLPLLLDDPKNTEARQATLLAAHYGGNAINTQLAGYVHAFAHSIGALYHIPHGKAIAWCLIPVMKAQEYQRYGEMAELARHCGLAGDSDSQEEAADKLITAIRELLDRCGLEKKCEALREKDYAKLTRMINADSINYSPSRTLTDSEIKMLLDQIRRGY